MEKGRLIYQILETRTGPIEVAKCLSCGLAFDPSTAPEGECVGCVPESRKTVPSYSFTLDLDEPELRVVHESLTSWANHVEACAGCAATMTEQELSYGTNCARAIAANLKAQLASKITK